jgi:hypothetical protein
VRPGTELAHMFLPIAEVLGKIVHKNIAFEVLAGQVDQTLEGCLVQLSQLLVGLERNQSHLVENKSVSHSQKRLMGRVVTDRLEFERIVAVGAGVQVSNSEGTLHLVNQINVYQIYIEKYMS